MLPFLVINLSLVVKPLFFIYADLIRPKTVSSNADANGAPWNSGTYPSLPFMICAGTRVQWCLK